MSAAVPGPDGPTAEDLYAAALQTKSWPPRCPLTYAPVERPGHYSPEGLGRFSSRLRHLAPLPFTTTELHGEAARRATKMSIGGAQPKVSARLSPSRGTFELVDIGGHYILKPGHPVYAELPANEDLSMRMAAAAGIETPLHGLVFARDATLCYVVRRFDRVGATGKRAVEDVGQLLGVSREAKYTASMEDVASVLDQYATIPVLDHERLLRRTLVAFLLGDEDLHIRNLSLLTGEAVIRLSPAYDIVNTTLAQGGADDELALPLGGRKAGFERGHFTDYFGRDVLGLRQAVVEQVVGDIRAAQPAWDDLLGRSFLSEGARQSYADLLARRRRRLGL